MKILLAIVLFLAVAWTAFVVFANMVKGAETGPFIGLNTIIVAWIVVGLLGLAAA
jgi:hypothetical protein